MTLFLNGIASNILIPMDYSQTDHLKAYGLVYKTLEKGIEVEWILNYRGGSFIIPQYEGLKELANSMNISLEFNIKTNEIYNTVQNNNMEVVVLEKAPNIALYEPPYETPWDDAVTLALEYADIPYDIVWDPDILNGELYKYDWLHIHHIDFTGQYGKFYIAFPDEPWYKNIVDISEKCATELGYSKVSQMRLDVAKKIVEYIKAGGFLFAMCSATDSIDIALAANGMDICDYPYDGDGYEPAMDDKLDYDNCLAFENFTLEKNPFIYEFSTIDTPRSLHQDYSTRPFYFTLFEFSAKVDTIPSILTQCHKSKIPEFMGQTTAFNLDKVKKNIVILARVDGVEEVKYIYGVKGEGCFSFLAGHDPEDYQHIVGEPPTELKYHPNSGGYRLILNNILFPAARMEDMKT
jgi:hypothetical protein